MSLFRFLRQLKRVEPLLESMNRDMILHAEQQLMLQGRMLAELVRTMRHIDSLREVEFKVFSQFGDDGIIQWLIHNLEIPHETFVEFGVENYQEANTRFLMQNDNWSGLVMDGSEDHIRQIRESNYYWRHELQAQTAFIDCENINQLLSSTGFPADLGLLHIDLDGNDYWIWKEISCVSPIILILEYNSVFGAERAITVPYDKTFYRTDAHFSNLYFGASLAALHHLSTEKGYSFIGCNSAGNNAYFVRTDRLNDVVRPVTLAAGYVRSKFRESRDPNREHTYLAGDDRLKAIAGMPVYNVLSNSMEIL